jgi:ribosomal protein S19E (S16A)
MHPSIPFQTSQKMMEIASQARALRSIADGDEVDAPVRERLEGAGLIEEAPAGWTLTQQGRFALAFAAAR